MMKAKKWMVTLAVVCALLLLTGVALAASCELCGGAGYVALKAANSDQYVAVPCPQCSGGSSDAADDEPAPTAPVKEDNAMSYFPGYTEIKPNESIKVKGVGKFTFYKMHLNDPIYHRGTYSQISVDHWLEGHFENTATGKLEYKRLFQDFKFNYINEDNIYSYDAWTFGEYTGGTEYFSSKLDRPTSSFGNLMSVSTSDFIYASIDPLEDCGFMVGFNSIIPDRAIEDEDGIIALTFQLMGSDEKYVFFARR